MTERLVPYWLVTTAVHFLGTEVDVWRPTVRVCLSYKMAEHYLDIDQRDLRCRSPEISGPFYKKVPRRNA